MNWGTRSTCVLHVGNGIDVYTQPCDRHSVVGIPHFFDTVGVFNPSVYANNTINSGSVYSSLGPIYVQVPVSGYSVICRDSCVNNIGPPYTPTYSFDMNFILLFSINVDKPTNASYIIDYGDGTVTMATDMPEDYFSYSWNNYRVFDFNHTYTRGNNYTVKVIIWNLVSNVTYEVKHDLFEVIKDLDFTVTEIDPVTGNYKAGGGPDQNYFALEHEIRFLASHTRGTHVTYTWVYGDDDIYSVYFDKESLHFYTDDFTFTVDLIATNKLSSRNISKTIHIQRGCWNISLSVDDPRSKNTSFDYQFDLGAIGTNACYYVDFVDKTSVPSQYLMFGDTTQCSQVPEWSHEWTNPNRNFFELDSAAWRISHENDTSKNITIRNMFMWQGVYPVRIQCKNKVSHTMYNYTTRVTKGPCWWPYVNLTRPNKCFSPMCDENNVKTHYRSNKLIIYSDVVINCTATNISIYTWSVFKVNENTGNETELSSSSLGNADLQSIGARLLIIESTYLEYGLYRFSLNVSMNELMGMYTIDTVYIRIIPTPLVVQISGGSMQKKKWGTPLSVDGITMTYDPDIDQSDKTGLTFIWLCRRLCESWPEFDADFNIIAPMEENCTYTPAFANDRGCSKVDNFDSSG
ncbi:hypothetical protein KUTeg_004360 [Tegillarca granosa]|uniref:PKD domain-containing protein n=1 Tax=Tegillarca granosa TaxID=220873 RepID=A0ABQ9FPS9_TEGGR|nr:hypothetical protein KUTeg_004360 [Tegillarca granosa]